MEEHIVGLVVLIAVTVDALAYLIVIHGNLVIENLRLFKRGKVTLGNLHVCPRHIRRLDETIRQVFINRIFGHIYLKRGVRQPLAFLLTPDFNLETLTIRGIEHSMPFLLRYLHLHPITVCLLLAIGCGETCHTCFKLVSRKHEIKWRNIARYGDIAIIRENSWQALSLFG